MKIKALENIELSLVLVVKYLDWNWLKIINENGLNFHIVINLNSNDIYFAKK